LFDALGFERNEILRLLRQLKLNFWHNQRKLLIGLLRKTVLLALPPRLDSAKQNDLKLNKKGKQF